MIIKTLQAIILISYSLYSTATTALPIGPGDDLYHTRSASIDLSSLALGITVGPLILVSLPDIALELGNTDTIIRRTGTLPDGETGNIPIEVKKLSLKGKDPVEIDPEDLPDVPTIPKPFIDPFWEVFIEIDIEFPPIGEIEIIDHDDSAEEWNLGPTGPNMYFSFTVEFVYTEDPSIFFIEEIVDDNVSFNEVPWSHTPAEYYPTIPNHGGFYPTIPNHPLIFTGSIFNQTLVAARIPEPNGLLLLLLGFSFLCFKHTTAVNICKNTPQSRAFGA